MTSTPTVSVIIPAYRVTPYIAGALQSVFAQRYTDYEVIVVNDGTPDTEAFEAALAPYRERLVYLRQENRGPSAARNAGIRAARGRLIALLDADDLWEPDYLSVQVAGLDADPTLDVLYPDGVIFGDVPEAGRRCMSLSPSDGEVTFERLVLQHCSVLVFVTARREALTNAGLFDETLRSAEDFDLWLRLLQRGGRIAYHRKALARYRRRGGSLSSDPVWMLKSALRVFAKFEARADLTPSQRAAVATQRTRFEAELHFYQGKKAFFDGDVPLAVAEMSAANAVYRSRKIALAVVLLRLAPGLLLLAYDLRDRLVFGQTTRY